MPIKLAEHRVTGCQQFKFALPTSTGTNIRSSRRTLQAFDQSDDTADREIKEWPGKTT